MADLKTDTVLVSDISSAAVGELALEFGLQPTHDTPFTNGVRTLIWGDPDRAIRLSYNGTAGVAEIVVFGDPQLADACKQRFAWIDLAHSRDATRDDLVRANFELAAWVETGASDVAVPALALLCTRLSHDDDLVRWSASRLVRWYLEPTVVEAYEAALAAHPDLAPDVELVRARVRADQDGTFWDTPTDSWHVLIERARAGVEHQKFVRTENATEMLLADAPYHAEGLLLRAYAYDAGGDVALALGLAGASLLVQETDPESSFHTPELLTETQDAVQRLTASAAGAEFDEDRFDAEMRRWFQTWTESYHGEAMTGFARALVDVTRPALFSLIAGRWDNDVALLRRAHSLVPDSAAATAGLSHALANEDPVESHRLLEAALLLVDAADKSAAAQDVDAHDEGLAATTRAGILEVLTQREYDAQQWDEAARLADALVAEDPESTIGWQMRANARTFALRHEDAVDAYHDALARLDDAMNDPDAFYLGGDPRPGMQFNLSCVQAKLGRREQALDALRVAAREDEKFAGMAAEDDYWSDYFDDPDFKAIVSLDPRALVLAAELHREYIEDLAIRALARSHTGDIDDALDYAERTIQLAEIAGFDDLLVRGLAVQGRTLAFYEDPHVGLESLDRAMTLVDGVDAELRAATYHDYGAVLHAAELFDRARDAYVTSLEQRIAMFGDSHPVLAKCFGDLARLASDVGDADEADAQMAHATDVLDAYFALADFSDPTAYGDALVDRANLWSNRTFMALRADDIPGALPHLERTLDALEAVAEAGFHDGGTHRQTTELVEFVRKNSADAATRQTARALAARLDDLVLDPDPDIRREQVFWRGLRSFARRMAGEGVPGDALAEAFRMALRGDVLPDALREIPEVAGLADDFARRAARFPTFLVTAAMALEMAIADGDLDGALEQLEGICVASVAAEL